MFLSNLVTPTYSTYMEVSFLQGLLGRRRRVSSLGLWKGSFGQSQFEKVRNPLFCWDQWGPMSAGRQMEILYSGYMERKSTFHVYFGVFGVFCRQGESGLWVCTNKEIRRGS